MKGFLHEVTDPLGWFSSDWVVFFLGKVTRQGVTKLRYGGNMCCTYFLIIAQFFKLPFGGVLKEASFFFFFLVWQVFALR